MKKLLIIPALLLLLGGCSLGSTVSTAPTYAPGETPDIVSIDPADNKIPLNEEPAADAVLPAEEEPGEEPGELSAQEASPECLQAYRALLLQFVNDHVWPDGTAVSYDPDYGPMEQNSFAICELTGGGEPELTVSFSASAVAGMEERVFSYADGQVLQILSCFPAVSWYSGGLALIDLSHNQGLSAGSDFWPYSVSRYDPETGSFVYAAGVDAWDGTLFPDDGAGNAFPSEIDAEGTGMVYMITEGDETRTLSGSDYNAWLEELLAGREPIELTWQAMEESSIAALQ